MKLTINKDCYKDEKYCDWYKCTNCNKEEVCNGYHFCPNCGEPIEWITDRTVEEVLEELILEAGRYGVLGGETQEKIVTSLKQELLNKINK